jgi:superfamily II DNA/RNA helicase
MLPPRAWRKGFSPLPQCNYVVLDEADRMIDLGFEPQVHSLLDAMPSAQLKSENEEVAAEQELAKEKIYRTTHLYSATMPPPVERLARKYLRRPVLTLVLFFVALRSASCQYAYAILPAGTHLDWRDWSCRRPD